jgi:hypothetical protein
MKIKILKNKPFIWAFAFVLMLSACDLQEANINPNASTDASVNVLLPVSQVNLLWAINDFAAQSTSTLVQYLTGTLNVQFNVTTYEYLPANFQTTWNNHFYAGAMKDLKTIIEKSTGNGALHYRGVAKIEMAIALGYLVDLWGDVPYSEALDLYTNPKPKFDSGEQLYTEIFRLLNEGIQDLQSQSTLSPFKDDLLYPATTVALWRTNSIPKWIKAANALKARYANHLSKVDPAGSAQQALDAIAAGTFTNNAEELKVSFGITNELAGPWYSFLRGSFGQNNISINQGFINLLRDRIAPGQNDPRLPFYVQARPNGTFVGTPYGSPQVSGVSVLGSYVNSPEAPTNIITYAEVKFIEAEARFRLNQFAEAATAFNQAVRASIQRVTGSAHAGYESKFASEDETSIQINGLQKIFTEKYIAMFLQTEAWTDWRRSIPAGAAGTTSGIPALTPSSNNRTNGVFPRRFLYPPSELDNNSANVPPASLTDRVFWDK